MTVHTTPEPQTDNPQPKHLHVIGYAAGFTQWHAFTADSMAVVRAEGYFDGFGDMLRPGDRLMVTQVAGKNATRRASPGFLAAQDFVVLTGGRGQPVEIAPMTHEIVMPVQTSAAA
ncbi:MAG: hypothetical protein RIM84_07805 [Alphaproteobacteria bacterium]